MIRERKFDDDDTLYVTCDALTVGDYGGYGSVGEANMRALADEEGARVERGWHGSRTLWLPATEEYRELVRRLNDDYPLVSDEEHSVVEMEWEREAWDNYGIADLSRELRREHGLAALGEALSDLPTDVAWDLYRAAMEEENRYPEFEYSGAALPLDEIALTYADLAYAHFLASAAALAGGAFDVDDDVDRRVLADWCEDNGHEQLADIVREFLGIEA